MFNKKAAALALEELGFCYMGRTESGGLDYFSTGHSVLLYDAGAVHTKPSGRTTVYRSASRVLSGVSRSLALSRLLFILGLCGFVLLFLLILSEGWVDLLFSL